MKRIAIGTSGSDAPGMNACIRAVVRSAYYYNLEVVGIVTGYDGMIKGNFIQLDHQSVSNIIQLGGTILKCGVSEEFKTKEGRGTAYQNLKKHKVDGLVVIGGEGTFIGAKLLEEETGIPCVGIPGTLDNDLYGTDFTIGYDTAVNTALMAIDQLRDTADSHERIFFIDVVGKDNGLAISSAISGGAEMVILPENDTLPDIINRFETLITKSNGPHIIIVLGDESGKVEFIYEKVKSTFPALDVRITSIGYVQRGGEPSAADRVLASQLGVGAVEGLINGKSKHMVGVVDSILTYTPFAELKGKSKPANNELDRLFDAMKG